MRRLLKCLFIVTLLLTLAGAQQESDAPHTSAKAAVTANLPSEETVNSFLHQWFGYDSSLSWKIASIKPSEIEGLSEVNVLLSGAQGQQPLKLYVTPDGKYVVGGVSRSAGSAGNLMSVVDTQTNEVAWTLSMKPSPSPMAISANPDGSTKWVFAQVGGEFNGFAVVDFATHEEIKRIKNPDIAPEQQNHFGPPSASHGIIVTSDQKTLLVNSRLNSTLYAYSLPDIKLVGGAALSGKGASWLTITPDEKTAYVANEQTNDVSVVDIKSLKEIARVPVGFAPARNIVWMVP